MAYYHVILERYTAPFTADEEREIETLYARIRVELPGCWATTVDPMCRRSAATTPMCISRFGKPRRRTTPTNPIPYTTGLLSSLCPSSRRRWPTWTRKHPLSLEITVAQFEDRLEYTILGNVPEICSH